MALITVDLPWFPRGITAHNNGSWKGKAELVKGMRGTAFVFGKQEIRKHGKLVGPVWVEYEFHTHSKTRDEANTVQCCKPYIDGIVDSGLIDGDRFSQLRTWGSEFVIVPKTERERVILRFMPISHATRGRLSAEEKT